MPQSSDVSTSTFPTDITEQTSLQKEVHAPEPKSTQATLTKASANQFNGTLFTATNQHEIGQPLNELIEDNYLNAGKTT